MRNIPNYQIEMVKGDTFYLGLELEGLGQDLATADFTVKKSALDSEILIHKDLTDGIMKKQDNQYLVKLEPEDTSSLDAGMYHYDMQFSVNNCVYTPLIGIFILAQDVTFEEVTP